MITIPGGEDVPYSDYRVTVRRWVDAVVRPAVDPFQRADRAPTGPEWKELDAGFSRDGLVEELPRRDDGRPDWRAFGILLEELARVSTATAMHVINRIAVPEFVRPLLDPDQREVLDAHLAGGLAGAFTEPDAGSDPGEMRTTATRTDDGWVINGRKLWISGALEADILVLSCRTAGPGEAGFGLFLVERDRGWTASPIPMLGLSMHPVCEVVLEEVRVPAGARIAPDGRALADLQRILAAARCTMASMSVGIAQAAFDASVAYSRERSQFGRPLAGFQLIQDKLVGMATDLDCGRLLARRALAGLDAGGPRLRLETSMAKLFCTEMCVRVASEAIQIHGAMGLARETGIERIFRDARMMTIPDGTTEIQKLIVGRELTGVSAFGR